MERYKKGGGGGELFRMPVTQAATANENTANDIMIFRAKKQTVCRHTFGPKANAWQRRKTDWFRTKPSKQVMVRFH